MSNGNGSRPFFLARRGILVAQVRTIVDLWREFYGSCARARHGAICRRASGSGFPCGNASADGRSGEYLRSFLRLCPTSQTSNTLSSMVRSSRSTGTQPAQKGTLNQAIGSSRGGLTTKIVALADALGNLVRFVLLPGGRHDSLGVERLITDIEFAALIADKAFDNNAIRARSEEHTSELQSLRHLVCRL